MKRFILTIAAIVAVGSLSAQTPEKTVTEARIEYDRAVTAKKNEDGSTDLVSIPGVSNGRQQVNIHTYIQNFTNEAGGVYKDESITVNVNKDNG